MALPRAERVTLVLFAANGARLRTIVDSTLPAGRQVLAWDGRDEQGSHVRKGMYFIHVRIGDRARQVRVTFLQ